MFKRKDKNDEAYIPETERFKEKLEEDEKRNSKKRKSSSEQTLKIKKNKI